MDNLSFPGNLFCIFPFALFAIFLLFAMFLFKKIYPEEASFFGNFFSVISCDNLNLSYYFMTS